MHQWEAQKDNQSRPDTWAPTCQRWGAVVCTRASSELKVEDTYAFIAFFAFIAFGAAFAAFIALAIAMRVVGGGRALGEGTLKPELEPKAMKAKKAMKA